VRTKEQIEASGAYEKTDYTPAFNDIYHTKAPAKKKTLTHRKYRVKL
jgi:hypothetical protein